MEFKLLGLPLLRWKFRSEVCKGYLGLYRKSKYALFSSSVDVYLENLVFNEGCVREINLLKYFESIPQNLQLPIATVGYSRPTSSLLVTNSLHKKNITELIDYIKTYIKGEHEVPNCRLNYLLISFAKSGNTSGVEAVQFIVKTRNFSHFNLVSGYQHYLAEALWINGKINNSLELFGNAYDNSKIQLKVKFMLASLFPRLITEHGKVTLEKTINVIEKFSVEKQDHILLAYLWKVLFQSPWYSDQELASKLLKKQTHLLQVIQWIIPKMGNEFLKQHRMDDFHRLLTLALENNFIHCRGILIMMMFEYYYIHQNIKRCSEVVKFANSINSPLTEGQQRKYIGLLLKSKNSVISQLNIKKPQNFGFKF